MKRIALGLAGVLAVTMFATTAGAGLCQKCQGMMYTADIGTCTACGGQTSSGAFTLCKACSEKQGKCQHCTADLKPAVPVRAGGDAAVPAVGGLPAALDLTKSSQQTIGRWKFLHLMRAPGTRSERSIGQLYCDGKELPPAGINDYYQTPWGALYWVGTHPFGQSGWMPARIDPKAQGKALEPPAAGPADLCLGDDDGGKTVEACVGQKIVIRLAGNPTTGFAWLPGKAEGGALKAHTIAYAQKPAPEGMVGVGGEFTAVFEALKAGEAKITLDYKRAWEKDTPPAKTFTVTVNVKAPAAAPADLTLTDADAGKTVGVIVGQTLVIRLPGNVSTGFAWSVKPLAGDSAVTVSGSPTYEAPDPRSARPGAGGTCVVKLEAARPGTTAVVLEYKRPWEKGKAPAKTFTVTVQVKAAPPQPACK